MLLPSHSTSDLLVGIVPHLLESAHNIVFTLLRRSVAQGVEDLISHNSVRISSHFQNSSPNNFKVLLNVARTATELKRKSIVIHTSFRSSHLPHLF